MREFCKAEIISTTRFLGRAAGTTCWFCKERRRESKDVRVESKPCFCWLSNVEVADLIVDSSGEDGGAGSDEAVDDEVVDEGFGIYDAQRMALPARGIIVLVRVIMSQLAPPTNDKDLGYT